MSRVHGASVVRNGLVLHLDAANSKSYPGSGTAWGDLSGKQTSVSLINTPIYTYSNLGAFNLDGINQYVECGNDPSINFDTGDFTVSIWFTRTTNATTNLRLLSKAAGSDTADAANAGFCFLGSDSSMSFAINPTGTRTIINAGTYELDTWTNVVGLLERGVNMRTYKNAVRVTTAVAPTGSVSGTTSLRIASHTGVSGSLYWPGLVSNVMLYNRALTPTEISQNFEAFRGRYGV